MLIADLFESRQAKTVVIIPGGFHPFHPGHMSLYRGALRAFPDADIFFAATNDTKTRPFPFTAKQQLASIAGVPEDRFIQVRNPFKPNEITDHYDARQTRLIFIRSEKDREEHPVPGESKRDGSPSYFQLYDRNSIEPLSKCGYMAYLPTIEFGTGSEELTSATEIRDMWPECEDSEKRRIAGNLYPATKRDSELLQTAVDILNSVLDHGETITEEFDGIAVDLEFIKGGLAQLNHHIDDYIDIIAKAEKIAVDKIAKHPEKKDKIQRKFNHFVEKLKKSIVKSDVELSLSQYRQEVASESRIR